MNHESVTLCQEIYEKGEYHITFLEVGIAYDEVQKKIWEKCVLKTSGYNFIKDITTVEAFHPNEQWESTEYLSRSN